MRRNTVNAEVLFHVHVDQECDRRRRAESHGSAERKRHARAGHQRPRHRHAGVVGKPQKADLPTKQTAPPTADGRGTRTLRPKFGQIDGSEIPQDHRPRGSDAYRQEQQSRDSALNRNRIRRRRVSKAGWGVLASYDRLISRVQTLHSCLGHAESRSRATRVGTKCDRRPMLQPASSPQPRCDSRRCGHHAR